MSTSSFVGTVDSSGRFAGRYVHFDGYPTARGPILTEILAGRDHNLALVLDVLTRQHYGWSSLSADTGQEPKTKLDGRAVAVAGVGYAYTTHQDQADPNDWITGRLGQRNDNPTWCEWAYLFTSAHTDTASLAVIQVEPGRDGERYHERARISVRLLADLNGEDWTKIECGETYRRCLHYAWVHFDVPDESHRLSTRAWLRLVPLTPRDAIGATVNGRTYRLTGSGHDGCLKPGERAHHWYAAAIDVRTGAERSIAIYRRTPKRGIIREIPGVHLRYPPTAHPSATRPGV